MGRTAAWLGMACGLLLAHCATGSSSFEDDDDGSGAGPTTTTSGTGGTTGGGLSGGGGSTITTSSTETTSSTSTETTGTTSTETTSTTTTTTTTTTTQGCSNTVLDGGFEIGTPNSRWTETSTNFGTPLCTEADCGLGGGTGPHQGTWWAWFGGYDYYELGGSYPEVATIRQSLVIPVGATTLRFQMELPVCEVADYDTFQIFVDNDEIYYTDGTDSRCNQVGYQVENVDISSYADGGTHIIEFRGENDVSDVTNFFVDDVQIVCG